MTVSTEGAASTGQNWAVMETAPGEGWSDANALSSAANTVSGAVTAPGKGVAGAGGKGVSGLLFPTYAFGHAIMHTCD